MTQEKTTSEIISLEGLVCPGRGLGKAAVEKKETRLSEVMGAEPFPGTLNILLTKPVIFCNGHQLDQKGKQFAWPARINGVDCLITRSKDTPLHVIELIAAKALRAELGLKDWQSINLALPQSHVRPVAAWRSKLWELFYKDRLHAYYNDPLYQLFTMRAFRPFYKMTCQKKSEFKS